MKKRILTSVVLLPLLLAVLFAAPKILTAILFCALCGIGAFEMFHTTRLVTHVRMIVYSVLIAGILPLWCFYGMDSRWGLAAVFIFVVLLFIESIVSYPTVKFESISVCLVGGLLIPYLLSSLVRIMASPFGRYLILVPFIIAFMSDTGAYFIGSRFGRHKLAPLISPKKSVEGVYGGVASAIFGMLLYTLIMQYTFDFEVNYGYALVYAILGSVTGVFGDLCFSVIKRQTGIKDYGKLIPGHGGVLDRFDSVILVSPLVELLLIFLPVVVKV